jgi:hypothetical protein
MDDSVPQVIGLTDYDRLHHRGREPIHRQRVFDTAQLPAGTTSPS